MTSTDEAWPDRLAPADDRPVLFCLHWLGGSARSWDGLGERLSPSIRLVALDLPGFGAAAREPGAPVAEMAERVVAVIQASGERGWMLAGHSMGAKVALAVARQAEDGRPGLDGLSHLFLLAGSPPAPEPMDEARRETMLGWFTGSPEQSRGEAEHLIDDTTGGPLDPDRYAAALADILRLNRHAWVAWLESGSREDWGSRIGVLNTPALVVAGERDGDLGPAGQHRFMLPHLARAEVVTLPEAGHLLPLECPDEIARIILDRTIPPLAAVSASYRDFIQSDRVSARTRGILLDRAAPKNSAPTPQAIDPDLYPVLQAVLDRVVPQDPAHVIDLAAPIDAALATEPGDGWRYVDLPRDRDAYQRALRTLQADAHARFGRSFEALDPERQDEMLTRLAAGEPGSETGQTAEGLDPHQMALWFEDLRANAVRVYVSHPITMARMGYSGIGYGGDGERLQGFQRVGIGETEPWEPRPQSGSAS